MRKSGRRSLIWLAVLAVLLVGIYVYWIVATERRLAANLAQVTKPATIEAYEKLVDELYGTRSTVPISQPGMRDDGGFTGFPEDWEDILLGYKLLLALLQAKQAAIGVEVTDILGKQLHERADAEQAKMENCIRTNQDLVQEIRKMAQRGGPVYPLDFSQGFAMELPHLAHLRQCVRFLREDAVVKAVEGNYAEAVEDVIAGMKLGDALVSESILISQLVRIAVYGIMSSAVQHAFGAGDVPPELTHKLIAHVAKADNRQAFAESMSGERYMGLTVFSELRAGSSHDIGSLTGEQGFAWFYGSPIGRPILNRDETAYADIMNRIVVAASAPYYEAAPELERMGLDIENLPRTCVLSGRLLPALTRACQAQARHEAILDLLQLGILVEEYKTREGSYPATLDLIAADLGGSLPVDPFTGEGYHYKPSEDSFLLYSVSHNCIDDGGTHDPMNGDLVWRGEQKKLAESMG